MNIIKKIILGLLGIIALALLIALFLPKEYAVEREITINQPKDSVFNYVKYLKNQDIFSVWNRKDPKMIKTFSGTDGTIGFVYSWNSQDKNVGVGEQEIKKIIEGERIDFELRFKVPFESTDNAYMITEAISSNQTKVKWGFDGKMPYPMNLMLPIMNMEEMLGKDLQDGLNNLKVVLEK
ncbi:SRPBCC family protein [Flavobacterium gawalongense]|uniref:SRPBCC family protein n=1 Tax=Flavobacterium gawalongense TaxID=2594432 RepID=A0A553B9F1_9FLAO|nr:SRPBCC family protein [Flavobacterium gawalongense]TRW95906.1 SRPBCC family protein [Flavobacterium gawalongense]TRX00569.1 SRPBCC family protein [Flavobacterium gawalongense]TRX04861.1 SRPBCC family protein [Flavobacterium gawalongense]TRX05534.1 SRPBCC family protein [Flavobacterium gawalongense]TRX21421.1 SRPBCC family protein [Flavobacterium gawalongense]